MTTALQRERSDRRKAPAFFNRYTLSHTGRRVTARRATDQHKYVDRYDTSVVMVAVGIVLMSAMDAAFTLRLLTLGAIELNAVMAVLIDSNIHAFVGYKLALTSLATLLLVIHKDIKLRIGFTVNRVAQVFFGLYLCLMVYELSLFRMLGAI